MAAVDLANERKTREADLEASHQEASRYRSPYERWKASQGLPTIRAFSVPNVYEVELTPWDARGGSGIFINLDFVFNNPYAFDDRFNDQDGYFHEAERQAGRGEWRTNFIADVFSFAGPRRASAEEVAERARAGLTNVRGSVGGGENAGRQI